MLNKGVVKEDDEDTWLDLFMETQLRSQGPAIA